MKTDNNVKSGLTMNLSENFKFAEREEVKDYSMLDAKDTYMDARNAMLSTKTNFSDWNWYLNYIESCQYFAQRNTKAYPQYLLQLGYVPVVYMPTCVTELNIKHMAILDKLKIPYVKIRATSFAVPYFQSDMVDAWASKLDLGKYFGIAPEDVRTKDVIWRLFISG